MFSRQCLAFGSVGYWVWAAALGALACGPIGGTEEDSTGNGGTSVSSGATGGASGSAGSSNEAGTGGAGAGGADAGATGPGPRSAWDWAGIIGTGQSLAVGAGPVNAAVNAHAYENLMLALGEAAVPPFDPDAEQLEMVRLTEPLRGQGSGFPRPYPTNIFGETPHGAMAAQISALAAAAGGSHVTVHSVVGESGQGMIRIRKGAVEDVDAAAGGGIVGRAYAASIFEATAITRLARADDKAYGIGAIVLTHGETDSGSTAYQAEMVQLWQDYNEDLAAITGQTDSIPLITSQQHAYGFTEGTRVGGSPATLAQWRIALDNPGDIVCAGPKYQYPYVMDGIHLEVRGYEMLGEKYGQVYFEHVVENEPWQPLQPTAAARDGQIIRVQFQVRVPPLVWDEAIALPHAGTEWADGKGFEVRSGQTPLAISGVAIVGDAVEITLAEPPPAALTVAYALTSDGTSVLGHGHRRGQLRDSDPFTGVITGAAQPNYAVAFEMPVP